METETGVKLRDVEISYSLNGVEGTVLTDAQGGTIIEGILPESFLELSLPELIVEGEKYSAFSKGYDILGNETIVISLKKLIVTPKTRTLYFRSPGGNTLTGKEINADFTCIDNPVVFPSPNTNSTMNGELTVLPPINCEILSAEVSAKGFKTESFVIDSSSKIINLSPKEDEEKTSLTVDIVDESGEAVYGVTFNVELWNGFGGLVISESSGYSSQAVFRNLEPGIYDVIISDEGAEYSSDGRTEITVSAGKDKRITAVVSEAEQQLSFTVIDSESGEGLANSRIVLLSGGQEAGQTFTDGEGKAVIALTAVQEDQNLFVSVSMDGYITQEIEVLSLEEEIQILLVEATPSTSTTVQFAVFDEEGLSVENARVYLMNAENDSLVHFSSGDYVVTDSEGIASFENVGAGSYYGKAIKGRVSG
ncbi:MAG: hypothetical protein ACTSRU_20570, partial [Candidatus Hodarchaeales archaeon]